MNLKKLLLFHAVIVSLAGVLLFLKPALIPAAIGIHLPQTAYILAYFLGAAELGLAFLSFESRAVNDKPALRIICCSFIIFHGLTGVAEAYSYFTGTSAMILMNVPLRLIVIIFFFRYLPEKRSSYNK